MPDKFVFKLDQKMEKMYYFTSFKNICAWPPYEKIYTESLLNIINSTKNNSKTIIILLPSNFEFRFKNFVIKTFKKIINKFSQEKNILFIEIDQCVMDFFNVIYANSLYFQSYYLLARPFSSSLISGASSFFLAN